MEAKQYESNLRNRLQSLSLLTEEPAFGKPDFSLLGYGVEVKSGMKAMFGQISLSYDDGEWKLPLKSFHPETARVVDQSGFLKFVNKKWGEPKGDYDLDLCLGNVYQTYEGIKPIKAHYLIDRNAPYIQIKGKGFYHFKKDIGGFGTTLLSGNTQIRARIKHHRSTSYSPCIVFELKNLKEKSKRDLDDPEYLEWLCGIGQSGSPPCS